MKKLLVINAVALTESLIAKDTPNLKKLLEKNKSFLDAPIPAVTCSSQASITTGTTPKEHGIVANGWYFRDLAQVWLWRQANQLIEGEKFWDRLKEKNPDFTVAKMFWWYNMYSTADFSVTPRPIYRADGAKHPSSYSFPDSLNAELEEKFGVFPLFKFWGPMTDITSTQWIADATMHVMDTRLPNLCLTYLPHLDYNLQRLGPKDKKIRKDMKELDKVVGQLMQKAEALDYDVVVLSEYGIQEVNTPIHINRLLRRKGKIATRIECGEEHFDAGASKAFAVADHQLAHVYVQEGEDLEELRQWLEKEEGIAEVLIADERAKYDLDHERSGEIICLAKPNAWFTYYYWLDDSKAPDYARAVDIHRKPGYDPVELFMIPGGKKQAAFTLLKKKLGFRYNMQVIPLDANLVKGSHGVPCASPEEGPVLLSSFPMAEKTVKMEELAKLFEEYFA